MKITDLDFYLVQLDAEESTEPIRSLLVRLSTDSGIEGWGETPIKWQPYEVANRRNALLPILIGRNIFDLEELLRLECIEHQPLSYALETASWDLIGRAVGQPICRLLGGLYRQQIPLAVRVTGDSADAVAEISHEMAEQGYHCQIITSSGAAEVDCQTVTAICESSGHRIELLLDGCSGYSIDTARDFCSELELFDIEGLRYFLDPLNPPDLLSVAALRRQTNIPMAVGRALYTPSDVLDIVRCNAASFVRIDLSQMGGLIPSRKCVTIAEAAGLGISLLDSPSLGIGTAAMLHLAAAMPALTNANECNYHTLQEDLLQEPLEVIDGMITVPQSPGLGVEVDRAKVERFQIG